jgi:hypothetical protein
LDLDFTADETTMAGQASGCATAPPPFYAGRLPTLGIASVIIALDLTRFLYSIRLARAFGGITASALSPVIAAAAISVGVPVDPVSNIALSLVLLQRYGHKAHSGWGSGLRRNAQSVDRLRNSQDCALTATTGDLGV